MACIRRRDRQVRLVHALRGLASRSRSLPPDDRHLRRGPPGLGAHPARLQGLRPDARVGSKRPRALCMKAGRVARRGRPRLSAGADRWGLASNHRQVLRRVAFALDLDPRGCIRDGAEIAFRQVNLGGADVLLEPVEFVVPGIGTIHGFCASSHASAIWPASPASLADPRAVHQRLIACIASGVKRGTMLRKSSLVELVVLAHRAGQEALAQRAERHKADAKFFAAPGESFVSGVAPPERVFVLQRRDRLHRMRAANGLTPGFGQAEVFHLALRRSGPSPLPATSSIGTFGSTRCW